MRGGPTYDHERVSFNLARLRKGGEMFEIVIDPDTAIRYKESGDGNIREILKAEKIFADAKKGELASEETVKAVFGTNDPVVAAEQILKEGEIQLTAEHRQRIRDEKQRQLVEKIHRNAIDPKTGNPHPVKRIELAFEEAKIRIDEQQTIDAQLNDVVKQLQPVLPIRFEQSTFRIHLTPQHAPKLYGDLKKFGTLKKEEWMNDGSWVGYLDIPAGLQNELIDMLNNKTHGGAEIEKVKK